MKRIYLLSIVCYCAACVALTSCEKLPFLDSNGLTEEEVVEGLRQALIVGTDTAVSYLSATDGYFKDELVKILLPKEAEPIYEVLSLLPGGIVDEIILAINRAAEDAAIEAKPIFMSAIRNLTVADGFGILQGSDTAATVYLKSNTFNGLYDAFKPKIEASLGKEIVFGASAESLYSSLIGIYNTASINGLLFEKIATNSLSEHTTNRALNGLFYKVGREEMNVRKDVSHRVTDLMERVFAEQD